MTLDQLPADVRAIVESVAAVYRQYLGSAPVGRLARQYLRCVVRAAADRQPASAVTAIEQGLALISAAQDWYQSLTK